MLIRFLKMLVGIMLLPFCVGESIAFFYFLGQVENIQSFAALSNTQIFFFAGISTYIVLFFSGLKLKILYIFAHEAAHAVFTLLSGGKVKAFHVSKNGGSVTTTKTNVFISLGPYFFPFYTLLAAAVFFITGIFYKNISQYTNHFIYFIGLSIAFHFLMTVRTLKTEQSDVVGNGYLFSLTIIYLANVAILAGMLSLVFRELSFVDFFNRFVFHSQEVILFIWRKIPRAA